MSSEFLKAAWKVSVTHTNKDVRYADIIAVHPKYNFPMSIATIYVPECEAIAEHICKLHNALPAEVPFSPSEIQIAEANIREDFAAGITDEKQFTKELGIIEEAKAYEAQGLSSAERFEVSEQTKTRALGNSILSRLRSYLGRS